MLFSSPIFLFWFLPITLLVYYAMPVRWAKNLFLSFASVFFYAWGEPVFVFIMLGSVLVSYTAGILIDRYRHAGQVRKWVLVFVVFWHLSIFFVFKYWDFFFSNWSALFPHYRVPLLHIGLPIGISFFTFQSMSYVFDVYRSEESNFVQKNYFHVLLYISLFPQLIAGPIVRYQDIAHEINHRRESFSDFAAGITRFLCGLSKKVLIANQLAVVADLAFQQSPADIGTAFSWLAIVSYTLQIYFDFSAYSDMAIGLGHVFGFHFLENFRYPYASRSIAEAWRRWHISLGNWFRDYVYFPLGGSRNGKYRTLRNIFIVWLFTGIWHGASWTFILWGLFHFTFILLEKLFEKKTDHIETATWMRFVRANRGMNPGVWCFKRMIQSVYVFLVFALSFVFFRSPSVD
ncbi:MAG: MBOAT family O-acyltransferase, partial [Bacillota bacterium]|nr:MBOAT family O-acyltransferase [Bacillota bacterium]